MGFITATAKVSKKAAQTGKAMRAAAKDNVAICEYCVKPIKGVKAGKATHHKECVRPAVAHTYTTLVSTRDPYAAVEQAARRAQAIDARARARGL